MGSRQTTNSSTITLSPVYGFCCTTQRLDQGSLSYGIMSSVKRKGAPSANPSERDAKHNTESRPSKKVKSDKTGKPGDKKGAKNTDKPASSAPAIATQGDEPLFPRGGGSVLTPLEHRQITIQAKQDALFEDESGKPSKKTEKSEKKGKRKSSKKEHKAAAASAKNDEDAVRIEGLNYKVCAAWASSVLGLFNKTNIMKLTEQ